MKNKLKKINSKSAGYILIFIISLTCLIIAVINIAIWLIDSPKTKEIIQDVSKETPVTEYHPAEPKIVESDEKKDALYWQFIKTNLINIDFAHLKEINDEVVGWIKVEGTNVNYPIVQTTDNDFYLDHSLDKTENSAGWLFMDFRNNNNFDNKNTIIYAHNRKDKTMFGSLKNLLSSSWYNNSSNQIIKTSSETKNGLWQIFSVYVIETTNDYIQTDFADQKDFETFINLIKNRSVYQFDAKVTNNDQIITLSTCHGSKQKLVVHAKLIKYDNK